MTDDPRRAPWSTVAGEGEIGFQEYFVGRHHGVAVSGVRFAGVEAARRPAPGVLDALDGAEVVVIAPVEPDRVDRPGAGRRRACASAVEARASDVGRRLADHRRRGAQGPGRPHAGRARPRGQRRRRGARSTATVAATLVIDEADAALAPEVEAEGMRCVVTATIMRTPAVAAALARPCSTPSAGDRVVSRLGDLGRRGHRRDPPRRQLWPTLIADACARTTERPAADGDVVVVTQKIVSKAEGRLVAVDPDDPLSHKAVVEAESVRILRRRGDLVISETRHGFVCANAGVDLSNVERG